MVYLVLYVLLSVPAFQNAVRDRAVKEISAFLDTEVKVGSIILHPFNEVIVRELEVFDRQGRRCLTAETVGAGISIWTLLKEREIVLTYGEIIGLDARVSQAHPDSALNISFIIDAFKPKEKNKPPTKFDLALRNVVIRRSALSFDKEWLPRTSPGGKTDFNHLRMWDLKADLALPRIANDDFTIDLRRLAFNLSGGLVVEKLAFRSHITSESMTLDDFQLVLPASELQLDALKLEYDGFNGIVNSLETGQHRIKFKDSHITPVDLSWLVPQLSMFPDPFYIDLGVRGNLDEVTGLDLRLSTEEKGVSLKVEGSATHLRKREELKINVEDVALTAGQKEIGVILGRIPSLPISISRVISGLSDIDLHAKGELMPFKDNFEVELEVKTGCGDIDAKASGNGLLHKRGTFKADVVAQEFDVAALADNTPVGKVSGNILAEGSLSGKEIDGELTATIEEIELRGSLLSDIRVDIVKSGKDIDLKLESDNGVADLSLDGDMTLAGPESAGEIHADIRNLNFDIAALLPEKYRGYSLTGRIDADLSGNNVDNVSGELRLNDMSLYHHNQQSLMLDHLLLKATTDSIGRMISLNSDWLSGSVKGKFKFAHLVKEIKSMMWRVLPALVTAPTDMEGFSSDVSFSFLIAPDNTLPEFLNLPIRFLVGIPVRGTIDATSNLATLQIDSPFLQQGKNKLLRDIGLELALDGESGTLNLKGGSVLPVRRGELRLDFQVYAQDDNIFTDIMWENPENSTFKGEVSLEAALTRNQFMSLPEVDVTLKPSVFDFGPARWNIDKSGISYRDKALDVDKLRIWHDNQFVEIDGTASASPLDSIHVRLASIDVGYIFDLLNINYVTFGGSATGSVTASGAFSKEPVANTDSLRIEQLSYNESLLGDAEFKSGWIHSDKEVTIAADIENPEGRHTMIDGGVWIGRDSLSFDVEADKIPIGFLQPFMSNFASNVTGKASGKAKLFGTFKDIDLMGRLFADSIAMRLSYTNVDYHGSDSVRIDPGRIHIPSFRLYDRNGNSAIFSGDLTHRYFHDASFNFRLTDARNLLCFDTNPNINPDWYGVLYGNGSATVRGEPGQVRISVDMGLTGHSSFAFVLNDRQAAEDYNFLTFSDRRKEEAEKLRRDTVEDILSTFRKKVTVSNDVPTKFGMDVRASVSPSTLMTLVMDPVAGDKITARGNGNIQIDYDSESDQMQMFGKYTLEEGNYRFSLQDLILRDFKIRQGSSIAFNGDPMNADLDITASYRVNTNLADLDKSFSTDRDLSRTNVPVDAMLMVDGPMTHPDISFDIELPTLTQDVERKVKSIISTDDMMSRQIIYLLALNRFSTPEYMGNSSNGGEFASMASSTLSSQLSNMFGQLTDKFSLAPSFRSDKGDFSDIEVDVALSSRLLNNRLLINGNFGYRDKSSSQTTFVGDFDIEYLLRRGGNLRLKAYNHFNDQNYYLRQALTTQGLGIIYRKEFDNPFSRLRKKREEEKEKKSEENISED